MVPSSESYYLPRNADFCRFPRCEVITRIYYLQLNTSIGLRLQVSQVGFYSYHSMTRRVLACTCGSIRDFPSCVLTLPYFILSSDKEILICLSMNFMLSDTGRSLRRNNRKPQRLRGRRLRAQTADTGPA